MISGCGVGGGLWFGDEVEWPRGWRASRAQGHSGSVGKRRGGLVEESNCEGDSRHGGMLKTRRHEDTKGMNPDGINGTSGGTGGLLKLGSGGHWGCCFGAAFEGGGGGCLAQGFRGRLRSWIW